VRIFLDANILFSAAKSAGAIRELLERALVDGHTPCADAYVAAEARKNIAIKHPEAMPELDALMAKVEQCPFLRHELPPDVAVLLAEKDRPVLAAAVRLGCGALVTGDRTHFGALYRRVVEGVAAHSPRTLAEALGLARKAGSSARR
jgi:hypothetical protein